MNPLMTSDARLALAQAGFSRRRFLKGAGALIVAFRVGDVFALAESALAQRFNGTRSPQLDAWLAIAADGWVTACTGKCELGTGLFTAQTQLVAEELSVPLARVRLVQCDTQVTPDQGTTSGQQSHPTNFRDANLAQACATAREALVALAAARLRVPVDRLTVKDGVVGAADDTTKHVTYGELVGGRNFNLTISRTAKRKHPSQWTVLGSSVRRLDLPALRR